MTQLAPGKSSPADMVAARNAMQKSFVENTRLGIPVTFVSETLHSGCPGGTIFPMPANYGCAWNPELLRQAAVVAAAEARAWGADRGFSPVVNVFPGASPHALSVGLPIVHATPCIA